MNRFYSAVSSVLEVDEVGPETKFRETEGWCSLHGFGLLVMMENDWDAPLKLDAFLKMERVGELYEYAFVSFAAKLLGVSPETLKGAAYGQIPEWDSVNHIRLAMEAEKRFDVSYPIERIPEMRTVRDFLSQG